MIRSEWITQYIPVTRAIGAETKFSFGTGLNSRSLA